MRGGERSSFSSQILTFVMTSEFRQTGQHSFGGVLNMSYARSPRHLRIQSPRPGRTTSSVHTNFKLATILLPHLTHDPWSFCFNMKSTTSKAILSLTILSPLVHSFAPASSQYQRTTTKPSSSTTALHLSNDPEQPKTFQEKLDQFLDKPLFDPDQILENENEEINENPGKSKNPLVWFASLVKNDYETAEALFAAGIISFMVVLAQELLRMAKYGDAYHAFQNGSSGSLF